MRPLALPKRSSTSDGNMGFFFAFGAEVDHESAATPPKWLYDRNSFLNSSLDAVPMHKRVPDSVVATNAGLYSWGLQAGSRAASSGVGSSLAR